MIVSTLRLICNPEKKAEIINLLNLMIEPTMIKPGCSSCTLYQRSGFEDEILLLESWESDEKLHEHFRSDEFDIILAAMEMAAEKPTLSLLHVSGMSGMEVVEKARSLKFDQSGV